LAIALVLLLLIAKLMRRIVAHKFIELGAVLCGAVTTLLAAGLFLHFTCGLGNYIHWTILFAAQRRLPGFTDMLGVYSEPSLHWWLPAMCAALVLLHSRLAKALWARIVALGLLAAPFVWTLAELFSPQTPTTEPAACSLFGRCCWCSLELLRFGVYSVILVCAPCCPPSCWLR